ncbi:hypothetical protein [Bacillus sp. 491mf]|nr:hypothetical protein [Bacillus sp. 491mf]
MSNLVSENFNDIVKEVNTNSTKINKLKNAIQNNKFSVEELFASRR